MNAPFRPAVSRNTSWNLAKTAFQTAVFWFIFLGVLPQQILKLESALEWPSFSFPGFIAWPLLLVFSVLGVYSGYTMSRLGKGTPLPTDCANELVVQGPYKIVRNPMAVAGIGQGVCIGLILGSWSVVVYAFAGAILWHIVVRPSEEADLKKRFGDAYILYKQQVKCWIPRL